MYRWLSEYKTKARFFDVLEDAVSMLNQRLSERQDGYIENIRAQLLAVKDYLKGGNVLTSDMIHRYFDFGGYAVKNLEADDELSLRLQDLYEGLYNFYQYR